MAKLYQNIKIAGEDIQSGYKGSANSKFWNEGKWNNFINPLLPENCQDMTFVDIGCNAGMFLRLAKERGFRDVIGFERRRTNCKYALKYRDSLGLDYKVLNRVVGVNFDFDEMPVADVTLISNTHYYFHVEAWRKFLDQLQYKTRYCLIVSLHSEDAKYWKASRQLANVRNYFRNWREVGGIDNVSPEGDPRPRPMWSMLFESTLERRRIDGIRIIRSKVPDRKSEKVEEMYVHLVELAKEIRQTDEIVLKETNLYKQGATRRGRDILVQARIDLMLDVKHNGLKNPLLIKPSGQLLDGMGRLAILTGLGYESAIVRMV